MNVQEVIKETDNTIDSTKEILYNMKTIRVLGELKREIEERMDFNNPCATCTEYDYSEKSGALKSFKECIELINEQIKKLRDE